MTKEEAVKRNHYWVVALAGIFFAGAAAAQLMVWSLILVRKMRHPGYERVAANDATGRENLGDNDTPNVDGKQEPGDMHEGWPVGDEWGIVSHINSTFLSVFLGLTAVHFEAISPTSGLDYELWAVFLVWNTAESLVQAAVRGYTINVELPLMKSFVIPQMLMMNFPVLSPRVDMVKDVLFTITCLSQGATNIGILSAFVILINSERMWALRRLRAEIREEALPLLKPPIHVIDAQTSDPDAGVLMTAFKGVLQIARDMSTPLKIESAMWEDIPQTALQIIFIVGFNGTLFTKMTAAIGIFKIVVVVLMPPLLLEKTEPDMAYAERHIVGSAFENNRRRAAETIGRLLQAASSKHNAKDIALVSRAVRAVQQALVQDTESDVVKEVCALTLITNAKLICSIAPLLCRSMNQAFDFIDDSMFKDKKPKMAIALFEEALQVSTHEEIIANHEGVCHSLMKLTGKMYPFLEKPLQLSAIVLMHKANSFGSATLRTEFERFLQNLPLGDEDGDCRALAKAIEVLPRRHYRGIVELADSGSSEMRDLSITVAAQALKDRNEDVRAAAAGSLGSIGCKAQLPHEVILAIAQALEDNDVFVRVAAADALGSIGCKAQLPHEVILAIAQALKDNNRGVSFAAAGALESIGCEAQLPHEVLLAIAQALKDNNPGVRFVVAGALGSIGCEAQLPHEVLLAIAQALKDNNAMVRAAVAQTVFQIKGRDNLSGEREAALAIVKEALEDSNQDVRCVAAAALGKIGCEAQLPHEVILAIAQALKDSVNVVRGSAAEALRKIGCEALLPHEVILAIAQALNDGFARVRIAVAQAFFEINGTDNLSEERKAALAIVKEALKDRDEQVRCAAANALASMGCKGQLPHEVILAIAQALKDSVYVVRREAAEALGKIGCEAQLPHEVILAIAQALNDKDGGVRVAVARAFFEINGTDNLSEEREAALAIVKEALEHEDAYVRCAAVRALATIGSGAERPHEVILDIAQALKDECREVRRNAATALGSIGSVTELPHEVILDIAQALEHDSHAGVRMACAQSLASFGKSDEVRTALDTASREYNERVRAAAKMSLEKITSSEAIPAERDRLGHATACADLLLLDGWEVDTYAEAIPAERDRLGHATVCADLLLLEA